MKAAPRPRSLRRREGALAGGVPSAGAARSRGTVSRAAAAVAAVLAFACGGRGVAVEPGVDASEATPAALDLVEVAISPGEVRLRVRSGGDGWRAPLLLVSEERPRAVRVEGGSAVSAETRGELVRVSPAAPIPGDEHIVVLEFGGGLHRVGPADRDDRAAVVVTDASGRVLARTPRVAPLRAPLRAADAAPPTVAAPGDATGSTSRDESTEFARFCERFLLARWPEDPAARPRRVAEHWFGVLVPPAPDAEGAAISALPAVLADLHAEASGRAGVLDALADAGAFAEDLDAAWAVARHASLKARIGADAYREGLRRLVLDRAGVGAPATWRDLAVALEASGSPEGATYVRAWLSGPARPRVEARWRHDDERSRVLVRVDQVHAVEGGAPAAYPFTLPVRLVSASGAIVDESLEVVERRSLLAIPCEGEPVALTFDPDGALAGRVDLRVVE